MRIRIFDLPKSLLLLYLYNHVKQQGVAFDNMPAARLIGSKFKQGTHKEAASQIKARESSQNFYFNYIDLGAGPRILKVNLSNEEVDFSDYDHFHGKGKALEVIHRLDLDILEASKPKTSYYLWGGITDSYKNEESRYLAIRQLLMDNKNMRVVEEDPKKINFGMVSPMRLHQARL
jgi:hypothetical protein